MTSDGELRETVRLVAVRCVESAFERDSRVDCESGRKEGGNLAKTGRGLQTRYLRETSSELK
jgi:hypothetical protein